MTDFDKLIKEKAENASYPYQEAAWKQYKRKAGLHGGHAKYWVIGASSVLVAGAVFLLKPDRHGQPAPNQSPQVVATAVDSVVASQNLPQPPQEDTLTLQVEQKTSRSPQSSRTEQTKTIVPQSPVLYDTPKVAKKVTYGKPVVIDVDTITRMVPTDEELEKGHSRLY